MTSHKIGVNYMQFHNRTPPTSSERLPKWETELGTKKSRHRDTGFQVMMLYTHTHTHTHLNCLYKSLKYNDLQKSIKPQAEFTALNSAWGFLSSLFGLLALLSTLITLKQTEARFSFARSHSFATPPVLCVLPTAWNGLNLSCGCGHFLFGVPNGHSPHDPITPSAVRFAFSFAPGVCLSFYLFPRHSGAFSVFNPFRYNSQTTESRWHGKKRQEPRMAW